jgi:N-acetylmuramoyl-L-alanine amidase
VRDRYRMLPKLLLAAIIGWIAISVPQAAMAEAGNGVTVCIDPGHQKHADNGLEPVGPDAKEQKPRVTAGATGAVTGITEYELNLAVSILLKELLKARGYEVVMTRETHEVRMSNKERAETANRSEADLFVRIHADSSSSASVQGVTVLHPSASATAGGLYESSVRASGLVLDSVISRTGAVSRGLSERSDLAGFNWAKVPSLLIEMGFMSNPEEDRLMATGEYRMLLAEGIFEGIDQYFAEQVDKLHPVDWNGSLLLMREAPLYARQGQVFKPAGVSLSPQLLQAGKRNGGWFMVETWMGPLWLDGDGVLADAGVPAEPIQLLTEESVFYRMPDGGESIPVGTLAPQTVRVRYEWKDWRCIETWLGEAWIPPAEEAP